MYPEEIEETETGCPHEHTKYDSFGAFKICLDCGELID